MECEYHPAGLFLSQLRDPSSPRRQSSSCLEGLKPRMTPLEMVVNDGHRKEGREKKNPEWS